MIGVSNEWFGICIRHDGSLFQSGVEKAGIGPGFAKDDVVGCGLKLTQKTECADAMKCQQCIQNQRVIFFTKNGKLWGN